MAARVVRASPHTRGWTRSNGLARAPATGFPAHAGMDPPPAWRGRPAARLPRTRGDGPGMIPAVQTLDQASPHTRGWTPACGFLLRRHRGFPAHAGMDPARSGSRGLTRRLPRTRGDGPWIRLPEAPGCTASPHTRGWTCHRGERPSRSRGFPAHAGMDPLDPRTARSAIRLPRTRGDGPLAAGYLAAYEGGFPAHAGMDPAIRRACSAASRLPRTRGDGPASQASSSSSTAASPHTRGWTRLGDGRERRERGFPAHAGMDPARGSG